MTNQVIPAEAVEAAAKRLASHNGTGPANWEWYANEAKAILEAAAPHLVAPRKPKPGEGDYLPGWDDRKTLAELWQEHAPLPEGGLRDGTYDALIAVAKWGYQQRVDEDL